jgi:hypothetical protein
MARAPAAAAAAAPPADDNSAGSTDQTDTADQDTGDDEGGDDGEVIATIMLLPDGKYRLIQGDEDDDEGREGGEGEEPAAGEGEGEGGEEEPNHEDFDSVGELMRGVLEIVRDAEEKTEGKSAQDQLDDGFGGDEGSAPASVPGMAPKY